MELRIVGLNFLYAVLGVALMFISYRVIDRLTPQVDFPVELKNGNIAVANSSPPSSCQSPSSWPGAQFTVCSWWGTTI